jgi:Holliday junction DNA helicase RuvA
MISQLRGFVSEVFEDRTHVTIFTKAGVGYEVRCSFDVYPQSCEEESLYIHTDVRENAIDLYGFRNQQERQFFRQLLKVNGFGPKTSLLILQQYDVVEVRTAIENKDADFFEKIRGIGKKAAQSVITNFKLQVHTNGKKKES